MPHHDSDHEAAELMLAFSGRIISEKKQPPPTDFAKELSKYQTGDVVPPPYDFEIIEDLIYLNGKKVKKSKGRDYNACDCKINSKTRAKGATCTEGCINRMLYIECTENCSTGAFCSNRRFQLKQFKKVDVFKTALKGLGLRSAQDIKMNDLIYEFVGEVLDTSRFRNRMRIMLTERKAQHWYFMQLSSDEIVDSSRKGNISRFVNHSCEPNMETQKWNVNEETRIGYFAKRDIKSNEELTFNYQYETHESDAQVCFCGTPSCRGFIGKVVSDDQRLSFEIDLNDSNETDERSPSPIDPLTAEINAIASRGICSDNDIFRLVKICESGGATLGLAIRHRILTLLDCAPDFLLYEDFFDSKGLHILRRWLRDIANSESQYTNALLNCICNLPIQNMQQLKESRLFDAICELGADVSLSGDIRAFADAIILNWETLPAGVVEGVKKEKTSEKAGKTLESAEKEKRQRHSEPSSSNRPRRSRWHSDDRQEQHPEKRRERQSPEQRSRRRSLSRSRERAHRERDEEAAARRRRRRDSDSIDGDWRRRRQDERRRDRDDRYHRSYKDDSHRSSNSREDRGRESRGYKSAVEPRHHKESSCDERSDSFKHSERSEKSSRCLERRSVDGDSNSSKRQERVIEKVTNYLNELRKAKVVSEPVEDVENETTHAFEKELLVRKHKQTAGKAAEVSVSAEDQTHRSSSSASNKPDVFIPDLGDKLDDEVQRMRRDMQLIDEDKLRRAAVPVSSRGVRQQHSNERLRFKIPKAQNKSESDLTIASDKEKVSIITPPSTTEKSKFRPISSTSETTQQPQVNRVTRLELKKVESSRKSSDSGWWTGRDDNEWKSDRGKKDKKSSSDIKLTTEQRSKLFEQFAIEQEAKKMEFGDSSKSKADGRQVNKWGGHEASTKIAGSKRPGSPMEVVDDVKIAQENEKENVTHAVATSPSFQMLPQSNDANGDVDLREEEPELAAVDPEAYNPEDEFVPLSLREITSKTEFANELSKYIDHSSAAPAKRQRVVPELFVPPEPPESFQVPSSAPKACKSNTNVPDSAATNKIAGIDFSGMTNERRSKNLFKLVKYLSSDDDPGQLYRDPTPPRALTGMDPGTTSFIPLTRPPPPPLDGRALPPNWKRAHDGDGRVYYYHRQTNQVQWEFPTDSVRPIDKDIKVKKTKLHSQKHMKHSSSHHADDGEELHPKKKKRHKSEWREPKAAVPVVEVEKAEADTSTNAVSEKDVHKFEKKLKLYIDILLDPYMKHDCPTGRIRTMKDKHYLLNKFVEQIKANEIRKTREKGGKVILNDTVRGKINDYVSKYMSKQGTVFQTKKRHS